MIHKKTAVSDTKWEVDGWVFKIYHPILPKMFLLQNFRVNTPRQYSEMMFWRHINWFALFRVMWYDFQEVKWILVSLSDMQQKRDNSNENTWKFNETFSHLTNPFYSISNKFTCHRNWSSLNIVSVSQSRLVIVVSFVGPMVIHMSLLMIV